MNDGATVGLLVAFLAGLLSFLSPCVLPLVPSYVSFITGMSLEDVARSRRTALVHALLFVAGFSLVFIALGATATALGQALHAYERWISRVGGVLVIVFGLYLLGVLRIGALAAEHRVHLANKPLGYLGTVLVGVTFGAGWTPCLGPVLGAILTYAASEASVGRGLALLSSYSLGLAVPFVVAAGALGSFLELFQWFRRHLSLVNRIAGALLIIIGLLMVTDRFTLLAAALAGVTPEWLLRRL